MNVSNKEINPDTPKKGFEKNLPYDTLLLDKIFSTIDVALFVVRTPSRKVVMCNNAVERIFGYAPKEVIGRVTRFLHLSLGDYKKFGRVFLPTLDKTGVFRGEYRMRRKDGSTFFSSHTITEIRDESGNRPFVVSMVRDITDQKLSENALRESEIFYRKFFESSHDVILLLDRAGDIVDINPRGEQLLGYPRSELLEMNTFENLVLPEDHHIEHKLIREALKGRNSFYRVRYRTKEGNIILFDGVTVPRVSSSGKFLSTFCTLRDVTDRRAAEERLLEYNRLIRQMSAHLVEVGESERRKLSRELHDMIGQIMAAVNINLTIIRGQASGPLRNKIVPRIDDSLSLVEEAGSRIRNMISDLRPHVLDDYGLLPTLRWYGNQFASRTGIAVKVRGKEISPRPAPDVETNLFRIAQEAFTNVSKHAKATKIDVRITSDEDSLRLSINDDGIGYSPSKQTGSSKHRGWGLISIAERCAALGGSFRIGSHPTRGTRVVVKVPR